MNIFHENYGLAFLVLALFVTLGFLFVSLLRKTISPDYRKQMLNTVKEMDDLEQRVKKDTFIRLRNEGGLK